MNLLDINGPRLMWPDQPAGLTELFGTTQHRVKHDLSALLGNVKHSKVSAVADRGDVTVVRPSDWNAVHGAGAVRARLLVNVMVGGSASAGLRAQYSTDGSAWSYLDGATGPSLSIAATGVIVSAWVTLAAPALSDVFLRVVGINGDGVADPEFGAIQLQVQ